jgi:hypothetical protein
MVLVCTRRCRDRHACLCTYIYTICIHIFFTFTCGSSRRDFFWQHACCQENPATLFNLDKSLQNGQHRDWLWSNNAWENPLTSCNFALYSPEHVLPKPKQQCMYIYISLLWQAMKRHETSKLEKHDREMW